MKSLDEYQNPIFVKQCKALIEEFIDETPGIINALLATPDGFEITSCISNSDHSAENLAAVGSSMFAMGSSLVEELGLSDSNSITIDTDHGRVYIRSIKLEDENESLVLLLQANKKSMLAQIIFGSERLSKAIAKSFQ